MNKQVTVADIESIGQPLGKEFTAIRLEYYDNPRLFLFQILSAICRIVSIAILALEDKSIPPADEARGLNEK